MVYGVNSEIRKKLMYHKEPDHIFKSEFYFNFKVRKITLTSVLRGKAFDRTSITSGLPE